MNDLQVGDSVVVRGEIFVVGGFSPASVEPTLVFLNDPLTGERLEVVLLDELRAADADAAA